MSVAVTTMGASTTCQSPGLHVTHRRLFCQQDICVQEIEHVLGDDQQALTEMLSGVDDVDHLQLCAVGELFQ